MISNKKLLLQELKRNTWVIAVLFLAMLFLKPLLLMLGFESSTRWLFGVDLIKHMESAILDHYAADTWITYISAIMLGLMGFAFVFSKSKVDLYHSVPISRQRRFIVNCSSGMIIFTVLYTVTTIITMVISALNHFLTIEAVKNIIMTYFATLVHFIYSYAIVIIAVMLTGNIVVCFAAIATLGFIYLCFCEMICAYMNQFFITKTGHRDLGSAVWHQFPYLSPVASNFMFLGRITGYGTYITFDNRLQAAGYLIKILVIGVIVLVCSYYLYEKRSSETAGKAVSFKISQPIVRIPVVILAGLSVGLIMLSAVGKPESKWLWIGAVLGVVIVHFVMEIIFNLNFKAFFKNKAQLIASLVVTLFIILIFDKDLFGYDKYIPDRDKVKAATVVFTDLNGDINYINPVPSDDGDGTWQPSFTWREQLFFDQMFEDDDMIDKVYEIAKLGVASVDTMKADKMQEYYGRSYAMKTSVSMLNSIEGAAAQEVTIIDGGGYSYSIGGADGPTSVFIAGKINDEDSKNSMEITQTPDNSAKLAEAKQYLSSQGIEIREDDDDIYTMWVMVYYRLKNNKVILRRYGIKVPLIEKAFNDIFTTEQYKKCAYDIFPTLEKGAVYKVEVQDTIYGRQMLLKGDEINEFFDIYLSELKSLTVDDLKEIPVGHVMPYIKCKNYDELMQGYYIYPRFKKTLAFIESKGGSLEFFTTKVDADKIQSVDVMPYSLFIDKSAEETEKDAPVHNNSFVPMGNITYTCEDDYDKALIETIAPYMSVNAYGYSNHIFARRDERLNAEAVIKPDYGMRMTWTLNFDKKGLPQKLIDDLIIKLYENLTEENAEG